MGFKRETQIFSTSINTVTIGTGDKQITLGGENVLPLYSFDAPGGSLKENRPMVGVAVSDMGYPKNIPGYEVFYAGADSTAEQAKRAANMPGADFLVLCLDSAHPNNGDKPVDDCIKLVVEVANAVDTPLVIEGSKHIDKDIILLEEVAKALQGKNVLILSAHEGNYKTVATAAALAYGQNIAAESAVDINLAKQLNVLINVLGVKPDKVVMNLGSAAGGYGFEYIASTIERVKLAALAQNDEMLKMPIITPVSSETWAVKESIASEEDYPQWGSLEERGVNMEIATAAACLAAGSNAVILSHPDSVKTIAELIDDLIKGGAQ